MYIAHDFSEADHWVVWFSCFIICSFSILWCGNPWRRNNTMILAEFIINQVNVAWLYHVFDCFLSLDKFTSDFGVRKTDLLSWETTSGCCSYWKLILSSPPYWTDSNCGLTFRYMTSCMINGVRLHLCDTSSLLCVNFLSFPKPCKIITFLFCIVTNNQRVNNLLSNKCQVIRICKSTGWFMNINGVWQVSTKKQTSCALHLNI